MKACRLTVGAAVLALLFARAQGAPGRFVVERGPHHRVVEMVHAVTNAAMVVEMVTNRVTEIATGMHYRSAETDGQWRETEVKIELDEEGAVAARGPHKARFAPELNSGATFDVTTTDGERLRGHVAGLAYYDPASGKSVLFAEVRRTAAKLAEPNRIVYPNAFDDVEADIVYEYRLAGVCQLVVFRENPPPPSAFGLDDASSRLEVWTEFLTPPQPKKIESTLKSETDPGKRRQMAEPDWKDYGLVFGAMQMTPGKAFAVGGLDAPAKPETTREEARVSKDWQRLENRDFLIEAVEYPTTKPELERLPKAKSTPAKKQAKASREAPNTRMATRPDNTGPAKILVQADNCPPGYALDWTLVSGQNSITFGAGTYWVQANAYFGDITFNGGSVIKYGAYGGLIVSTNVTTHGYTVFTSEDDNTVGEAVKFLSPPTPNGACAALALSIFPQVDHLNLTGLDFRWVNLGIQMFGAYSTSSHTIANCSFSHGSGAVWYYMGSLNLNNCTFCDLLWNPPYGSSVFGQGQINPSGNITSTACADDYPNWISFVQSTLSLGSTVSGAIEQPQDQDVFRIKPTASGALVVQAVGDNGGVYVDLYDSQGALMTSVDARSSNVSRGYYLPAGTYYIVITQFLVTGTGTYSLTTTFSPGNTPPTIGFIPAQTVTTNETLGPILFTVNDIETPAGSLVVTKSSANTTIIPAANITLGGSGLNRSVTIAATNLAGTSDISLIATDAQGAARTNTFTLTVVTNSTSVYSSNLFNVDFASSYNKTGPARIGNANDYWNKGVPTISGGVPQNGTYHYLLRADGTTAGPDVSTYDAQGVWSVGSAADTMFISYLFRQNGNMNVYVEYNAGGLYDLYLYGHGDNAGQFANFTLYSGVTYIGQKSTINSADYWQATWVEGLQYVVFRDVPIQPYSWLQITVSPAGPPEGNFYQTFAPLNGLQLYKKGPLPQKPVISLNFTNQTILEDTPTTNLFFTLTDPDTALTNLTVSAASSVPSLFPTTNMVVTRGTSNDIKLFPARDQFGTATITLTVADGYYTVSTNFTVTVTAVNDAPVIATPTGQILPKNNGPVTLPFSFSDVETATTNLVVITNLATSKPWVIPNPTFSKSGTNWYITFTPATNQTGQVTIAIAVSDGSIITTNLFGVRIKGTDDFNGDGNPDLLWRNVATGENQVWAMTGTNKTSVITLTSRADPNWKVAGWGDFNNDGKRDILWQNRTNSAQVEVWLMNTNGTVSATNTITVPNTFPVFINTSLTNISAWEIAAAGDFDGNGCADLIWQRKGSVSSADLEDRAISFLNWTTNGIGITLTTNVLVGTNRIAQPASWRIAATGDFNNDGYTDIVWRETTPGIGTLAVWYMSTNQLLKGVVLQNQEGANYAYTDLDWKVVDAADLDHLSGGVTPGFTDVVLRHATLGLQDVLFLQQQQPFATPAQTVLQADHYLPPNLNTDWRQLAEPSEESAWRLEQFYPILSATVETNQNALMLSYQLKPWGNTNLQYSIDRRLLSGTNTNWVQIAPTGTNTLRVTNFEDATLASGSLYEYRFTVKDNTGFAIGASQTLTAGVNLTNLITQRGTVILLVDQDLINPATDVNATNLSLKIDQQLTGDLIRDGWRVQRFNVPRHDDTVTGLNWQTNAIAISNIHQLLTNCYFAAPQDKKAVFILGHVAIPYSGNVTYDGHDDHVGAWPADIYYGDMADYTWSDGPVTNLTAAFVENHNVPGDGKFVQNDMQNAQGALTSGRPEMAVGRVDFARLNAFGTGNPAVMTKAREIQLLLQYLDKTHAYRLKQLSWQNQSDSNYQKCLMFGNFGEADDQEDNYTSSRTFNYPQFLWRVRIRFGYPSGVAFRAT